VPEVRAERSRSSRRSSSSSSSSNGDSIVVVVVVVGRGEGEGEGVAGRGVEFEFTNRRSVSLGYIGSGEARTFRFVILVVAVTCRINKYINTRDIYVFPLSKCASCPGRDVIHTPGVRGVQVKRKCRKCGYLGQQPAPGAAPAAAAPTA